MNHKRIGFITLLILTVIAFRVFLTGDGNSFRSYTPVGAICLFAGAYFNRKWWAYVLPLAMLFVSDLIINGYIYEGKYGLIYDGWYYTYAVMAGIILIGSFLLRKVNIKNILVSSVASTLLFWLVLDFIVWAGGGMNIITEMPLSRDFTGLVQCYAQGLPFAKNFFLGTAVYSTFLFGVYEFSKSKIISFQTA
jgi:hypothetical protein